MPGATDTADHVAVAEIFDRRSAPVAALAGHAEAIARACRDLAAGFWRGGKLVVFGNGGPSTDAQHVAVEFVHPVIVGKRALPAISLTADVATVTSVAAQEGLAEIFAHQIRVVMEPSDIALGICATGDSPNVRRGLEVARQRGALTVGLVGGDGGAIAAMMAADHILIARSNDPQVVKEIHVTTYHIIWELVHVLLERPALLGAAPR